MPSVAGIHGVLCGSRGRDPADRDAAGELLRADPSAVTAAYQNRRFVESATQFMTACAGIRQFIDIGCGFPGPGAAHEIALRITPDARVAYADNDPSVVAQVNASVAGHPAVLAVQADLRQPNSILGNPAVLSLINLTEPVAIMLTAVLHFLTDDDDPGGIVATLMRAVAPGSLLVLSHAAGEHLAAAAAGNAREVYETAAAPFMPRDFAQVFGFFDGLDLLAPGVVTGAAWRPGYLAGDPRRPTFYAGLARKQ
jgi:hypothetical protein